MTVYFTVNNGYENKLYTANTLDKTGPQSIDCEELLRKFGSGRYALEAYYRTGFISLMVTVANIILICISSMLMFRMKEVLPIKKNIFWDDLSIARKVYQNHALIRIDNVQTSDFGMSNTSAPVFQSDNEH